MRYFLVTISVFMTSFLSEAQTGVIAFKSHSGNMKFFRADRQPDNLGWTGFEREIPIAFDTTVLNLGVDSTQSGPYCNNPNIAQDSLHKTYPFYTTSVPADSTEKKPAAGQVDTLAKHKERLKSRSEMQKNETDALFDFYGNPTNPGQPGILFVISLVAFVLILGGFIWRFNRKKINLA